MSARGQGSVRTTVIKVLGREYRVRSDVDAEHLQRVAEYVDGMLREVRESTPDTQDAAILSALNIASDLLSLREGVAVAPRDRLRALLELVDSA
jgi:cell division protein ZapA (FtsZ GTPase activity inhibitor)